MSSLTPSFIETIRQEYRQAPRGTKTTVLKRWAAVVGYSEQKLYKEMGLETGRKRRQGTSLIENIKDHTKTVFQIKKRPPEESGELSTDQAVAIAVKNGLVPDGISVATFNRVGRQLKLDKKKRRVQRFQADQPNQMHHIDASTSSVFYVDRDLPDGDYILKLNNRPSLNYKNKPAPIGRRAWVYSITDDYSGYSIARYTAAYGESMADNLDFLSWAWGENDDKPFFGLPEKIKADKGPMMKGKAAQEWLDRLDVEIDPSVPYAKEAHGKIERPWRTHWQRFEKQFFAQSDWKSFEITLSELNRQFINYFHNEYNLRPHRYERQINREQAWRKIALSGGAVALPKDAIKTTARRYKRKVAADGCFKLDNEIYEVKGLHDAWVYVILGVFENKMLVQDIATGEKYEVEDFKPNPIGTFTAHKDSPHQIAQKESQKLELSSGSLFEESTENNTVVHLPTKIKEERVVENIFDNGRYRSIDEAMSNFTSMTGHFLEAGSEDRADLEHMLIDNNLEKSFVRKVADDFLKANRRCGNA